MILPKDNGLKYFLNKSEERLKSVKKGEHLSKAISLEISHPKISPPLTISKGPEYESLSNLLYKTPSKYPSRITKAMQEYISSSHYSAPLEYKKNQNLSNFFLEKYQIVNSVFNDRRSKPLHRDSIRVEEKKSREITDRIKEKEKNDDPIDLRIKQIDDKINRIVDVELVQERLRRKEEERNAFDFLFHKKQKKALSISEKFHTINLKAKLAMEKNFGLKESRDLRISVEEKNFEEKKCESVLKSHRKLSFSSLNTYLPSINSKSHTSRDN